MTPNRKQAHIENALLRSVMFLPVQSLLNVTRSMTGSKDGYNSLVRSEWILNLTGVKYFTGTDGVTSVI